MSTAPQQSRSAATRKQSPQTTLPVSSIRPTIANPLDTPLSPTSKNAHHKDNPNSSASGAQSFFTGALKTAIAATVRSLLSLRYRVSVKGFDDLPPTTTGRLFIPNHPGFIDPVIVGTKLSELGFKVRPVVAQAQYDDPAQRPFLKFMRAIVIPDLSSDAGVYKRDRTVAAIDEIAKALKNGEHVLMYPSGRLMQSGHEYLGSKSGLFSILQRHPEIQPIMLRTTGVYGSSFSTAQFVNEEQTNFSSVLKGHLTKVLKNAIFFAPRREVEIVGCAAPEEITRAQSIREMNGKLEDWYNKGVSADPILVPYHFADPQLPELQQKEETRHDVATDLIIEPALQEKVVSIIARIASTDPADIIMSIRLDRLGIDSLAAAELLTELQELVKHEIEIGDLVTVASTLRAVATAPEGKSEPATVSAPEAWTAPELNRPPLKVPWARTIQGTFLKSAARMPRNCVAIADERSGVVTWGKLLTSILALKSEILRIPGQRVGIMLPSSVGASMLTMATVLANKTAVMINWTAGPANVEHAVNISNCGKIITSRAFLDKLPSRIGNIDDRFIFIEDIRAEMSKVTQLGAFIKGLFPAVLSTLPGRWGVSQNDPAVILFTSGSEGKPKAVPLSHRNLLSVIRSYVDVAKLEASDVLYGFLPPFHSFGASLCTLFPLLSGMKAVMHPNPNESAQLARGCEKWGVTLMAGTPTFLKRILGAGTKENFAKLRTLVSGADRVPDDLVDLIDKRTSAQLLEGYGITELSPTVTITRPGEKRIGVGKPLPGVTVKIVDPVTFKELPAGERGLIVVAGPSVFKGYLGGKPDPFIKIGRKKFYNTGDLGYFQEGNLVLSGRLKRFVKMAGEMVSLPQVEDALSAAWPARDTSPEFAVLDRPKAGQDWPELVLVTTRDDVTVDAANNALREAQLAGIVRVGAVVNVNEMPFLGSGKINLVELRRVISAPPSEV